MSALKICSNRLNKYVRLRGLTYIHTCRSYVHTPRELDGHAVVSPTGTFIIVLHALADSSDFWLLGAQSFPKWEMNRRAKFDAASFIFSGEIHNRTNIKHTNSNRYIHTFPIGMCG